MKCDSCEYQDIMTEDLVTIPVCRMGHWEGNDGIVPDKDPWSGCQDYQPKFE